MANEMIPKDKNTTIADLATNIIFNNNSPVFKRKATTFIFYSFDYKFACDINAKDKSLTLKINLVGDRQCH